VNLPPETSLIEVSPRDGLQARAERVPTDVKVRLIERIVAAGFTEIEATSFVHPRVVPQMSDAEAVMDKVPRPPEVRYRALVPNRKGADRAAGAEVDVFVALLSASEAYSRRNQNATIEEAIEQAHAVAAVAEAHGRSWTAAIAMAFFSPYEGYTPVDRVLSMVERLLPAGPEQVTLATTAGMAGPGTVARTCTEVRVAWPDLPVGLHLHNTNGMGLACALAGLSAGASSVESALCGIGSPVVVSVDAEDVGNIATEDLVTMLADAGVSTGLDAKTVVEAARDVAGLLGVERPGYAARIGTPEEVLAAHVSG
jgi:hydroxymethylglutaryl-CoA lyase